MLTAQRRASRPAARTVIGVGTLISSRQASSADNKPPPWRPAAALDDWVQREARPTSLRQLTVFGRTLTEGRLLSSANYVRLELPTRIAHRLRDLQKLPYSALSNDNISHVYELYYSAFERIRKLHEVKSLADNDAFCEIIKECLQEHLSVIPSLAKGVLEIQHAISPEACDELMTTMLSSRISRRVIAEQHLALTSTYQNPAAVAKIKDRAASESQDEDDDFVGEIFLKCSAREIVQRCATTIRKLAERRHGTDAAIPDVQLYGDVDTTFPYIPGHIEYIMGELLRNSTRAVLERFRDSGEKPPPIEVLVCETPQQVIFRISDQGGGVVREILPFLWSFARGPRRERRLRDLAKVAHLAGTLDEIAVPPSVPKDDQGVAIVDEATIVSETSADATAPASGEAPEVRNGGAGYDSSLSTFTARPPGLRLGIGLPMSKIYAEYWAGSLEVHSLQGYGVDAFLAISKLGNKNEVLSTRATMDAV